MAAAPTPLWQPLSAFLARAIVQFWPGETKQWGLAFEAELSEIATPLASFRWILGGVMLLTRERWKSFLRSFGRPIGVTAGSPMESFVKNSSRVPRTPRFVTALLFLASAAILLNPDVRSSITLTMRRIQTLGNATGGYDDRYWEPAHWSSVKHLRKEIEKNRDPKLLALVALLSSDEERLRLSEEAIHKDASLTWLDYEQPENFLRDSSSAQERIEQLRKWDPDNVAPRELAARALAYRLGPEWVSFQWPKGSYVIKNGALQKDDGPAPDAKWLAAMDEVFSASKYDTYLTREFELIREVTQKYGVRDPDIASYVLLSAHLPNLLGLRSYNNWVVSQSIKKEQAGNRNGALADLRKALRFEQHMWLGQKSLIEALIADYMGIKTCERLQTLLKEQGQVDEASLVAFQLAEWNADVERIHASRIRGQEAHAEWAGLTILLSTLLIFLAIGISIASLLVLRFKRATLDAPSRVFAFFSWALDAAPLVLLGACVVVYLSYQPFARTYHAYFSAQQPIGDFEGLFNAGLVTHLLPDSITQMYAPVMLWTFATAALSFLAALLLIRMLVRRFRHA